MTRVPPSPSAVVALIDPALELAVLGATTHDLGIAKTVAAAPEALFAGVEWHRAVHRALVTVAPTLNGTPPTQLLLATVAQHHGEPIPADGWALAVEDGALVVPANLDQYLARLRGLAARREDWAAVTGADAIYTRGPEAMTAEALAAVRARLARAEALRTPDAAAAIDTIDAADLVAHKFPDEPALVGGGLIVPRALVINGGQAKRGKSLLVLNREIRRAKGLPFLGFPTSPGRTL
jgi:hypothetical protein